MKLMRNLFTVLFAFFFLLSVASCEGFSLGGNGSSTDKDKDKDTETPDTPSDPSSPSQAEIEAMAILNAIEVNDYVIPYDGLEHHIREAKFDYPKAGNISYGSYTKYKEPGTYTYHIRFGLNGFYREVDVNLIIEKYKPVYTGPTEVRVFLDERDDFDVSFDKADVELAKPIHLTEVGDYTVTVQSKANSNYSSSDPVEVTVYVRDTHYRFGFDDTTVLYSGEPYVMALDETDFALDSELFDVTYTNNEGHTERGKYYVTATIVEKSNNVLYDEYRAILTIDVEDNAEFAAYTNDMFAYYFGDDQLTINILIGDYTQFGFEHQDAHWYSFEPYSDEDYQHDCQEVADMRAEFDAFDVATLSNSQLNDYAIINENIMQYEALFADKAYIDMRLSYVDQYGGYAADLPSEVEGYHINNVEDLNDMIDLLSSVYDSFMSYYDYIEYREELGYPLNEYTLTKFIEYLNGVVETFEGGSEYYLIGAVTSKFLMNNELGLTIDERKEYANTIKALFNDKIYNAHKDLAEKTQDYLDAALDEGGYLTNPDFDNRYLGQYEKGRELYAIQLRNKLGIYDLDLDEYVAQIDTWLKKFLNQWSNLSNNLSAKANMIADGKVQIVEGNDFQTMLAFLKEFAKTIVPDLATDPAIDVTWMDDTVTANTTTAAYYMKSPLTSTENEYIHMNPKSMSDNYLDTISTLAHEGYPGHLYAFVFEKENQNLSPFATLSTNTTHGEGWATYVQMELNTYIANLHAGDEDYADWKAAMEYANVYDLMSYLLYTRLDFAVGYELADVKGLKNRMSKIGLQFNDDSTYESLFHTFNESVATYPAYGFGKAYFYQLHLDAQKELGQYYDVVDFNRMLLEHGWCSIGRLQGYYEEYIQDMKFKCGIN